MLTGTAIKERRYVPWIFPLPPLPLSREERVEHERRPIDVHHEYPNVALTAFPWISRQLQARSCLSFSISILSRSTSSCTIEACTTRAIRPKTIKFLCIFYEPIFTHSYNFYTANCNLKDLLWYNTRPYFWYLRSIIRRIVLHRYDRWSSFRREEVIYFNRENARSASVRYSADLSRESILFFRMISQAIKLVDDRQEGAWAQFVAWLVVDNSKIYVHVGGEGERIS